MAKMNLGGMLFLIGVGGAALIGLLEGLNVMPVLPWLAWVLIAVGLLIGLMNIDAKEAVPVIVAALAIGAGAGVLSQLPAVGMVAEAIFARIAFISIPVVLPPAIKLFLNKVAM